MQKRRKPIARSVELNLVFIEALILKNICIIALWGNNAWIFINYYVQIDNK